MATMSDWRARLEEMLIEAGTVGIKQRDIVARLQWAAVADDLIAHLEALLAAEKVQRFEIPSGPRGGRPATIWRATVRILED